MNLIDLIEWHVLNDVPFTTPIHHREINFGDPLEAVSENDLAFEPKALRVKGKKLKQSCVLLSSPVQQTID
jgi:hypothetical protein